MRTELGLLLQMGGLGFRERCDLRLRSSQGSFRMPCLLQFLLMLDAFFRVLPVIASMKDMWYVISSVRRLVSTATLSALACCCGSSLGTSTTCGDVVVGTFFGGVSGAGAAATGLDGVAGVTSFTFSSLACLSTAALFAGLCPCFDRMVFLSRPHVPQLSCHAGWMKLQTSQLHVFLALALALSPFLVIASD